MYPLISERYQKQLLYIAAAVGMLIGCAAVLAVSQSLAIRFNLAAYLVTNTLVFVDAIDFLIRFGMMSFADRDLWLPSSLKDKGKDRELEDQPPPTLYQKRLHVKPWAIVLSVYNVESALFEFLSSIEDFRERVWIIDDGSPDGTCDYLRSQGWRCAKSADNSKKPGAISKLVHELPAEIETVIVIDPDIEFPAHDSLAIAAIEGIIFDFQQSDLAAICPRLVIRPEGFLSKFQLLEYSLAFFGRRSIGHTSITSGISLYRRSTFSMMLERHSKSVYAEDLENSVRLLGMGFKVGSEFRLVIETEGKATMRSWMSQRIGWSYGLIKVYFERFRDIRTIGRRSVMSGYQFLAYMGIMSLAVHPLKVISLVMIILSFTRGTLFLLGADSGNRLTLFEPVYFLAAFIKYVVFMLVVCLTTVPKKDRASVLPIVPLYLGYALCQTAATTIGYSNWITLRLFGRRIVKDHYDPDEELRFRRRKVGTAWVT